MSNNANSLTQSFLNLLESDKGKEIFDTLDQLMEILETKDDPDMTEVCIVGNLTEFSEKLQIMKSNLRSYVNGNRTLLGDMLNDLYDK